MPLRKQTNIFSRHMCTDESQQPSSTDNQSVQNNNMMILTVDNENDQTHRCSTPSNQPITATGKDRESSRVNKTGRESVEGNESSKERQSQHMIDSHNKEKRKSKRKKTDVSLNELMSVQHYLQMDGPIEDSSLLKSEQPKQSRLHDVCLDDLLNANSLPVSMRDGDFENMMAKDNHNKKDENNNKANREVRNKSNQNTMKNHENQEVAKGNSKIKIIEDFKQNSANNTQKSSKISYDSDSSQSLISTQNQNLLYKDDERLEPELVLESKSISSYDSKNMILNPMVRKQSLPTKITNDTPPQRSSSLNLAHKGRNIGNFTAGSNMTGVSGISKKSMKNINGSLINSNNIKILLNENEHEVQFPIISFSERSEPIILPMKISNHFSKMVATSEDASGPDLLNMTFPAYTGKSSSQLKFKAVKFPRKNIHFFSTKSIDTLDTAVGLKNLNILTTNQINSSIAHNTRKEAVKDMKDSGKNGSLKGVNGAKRFGHEMRINIPT